MNNNRLTRIAMLAMLFVFGAEAQTLDDKWGVGLSLGSQHYNGEYGNGLFNPLQGEGLYEFTVARNINEKFDVVWTFGAGEIAYDTGSAISFHRNVNQMNLSLKYYIPKTLYPKYSHPKLDPFVFGGLGVMRFSAKPTVNVPSLYSMQLPDFGLGVTFKLSPGANLVMKETFIFSNSDEADLRISDGNDFYAQYTVGIVFSFGGREDTDGDGVADKRDECPDHFGPASLLGCPDSDGDGVSDKNDFCPDEVGTWEMNGCPDSDGDGISDLQDSCPDQVGPVSFGGCPDTDGDGIADNYDPCPDEIGSDAMNGCPDIDGDGIADKDDACPGIPGSLENKGCPEIEEETTDLLEQALHDVKFQAGNDVLTQSSYDILDNLAEILNNHPEYKLAIKGHTDSRGNDNGILRLSQERVDAVLQFLAERGIAGERMKATGYGETQPIADNRTAAGRATNQRVELTIEF